ncbi:MAG: glycosyltransferase family 2 protein [Deltaproteobacteria bacterium]|nr:glycosyltransferase family 2 protein [Deltaproteobacteria bacterium]
MQYQKSSHCSEKRGGVLLSVIIPCLKAADTLGVQLDALSKQKWDKPWEVIVADNGSSDDTVKIVEYYQDRFQRLRIVDASDKKGPSHARNVGADASNAELLAFCDADDEVASGWVAAIGESILANDFVASRLEFARLSDSILLKGKKKWRQKDELIIYNYVPYFFHADTSGLGIKRSIHETIGGFDESMLCCEDCDYCWRAQLTGVVLHFEPNALVHKRHKASRVKRFYQARKWGEYNVLLHKKFRPLGMPKASWKIGARLWWSLLKRFPQTISHTSQRENWLWQLGYRYGHLHGSIKHCIIVL